MSSVSELSTALRVNGLDGHHNGQGVKLRPSARGLYFTGQENGGLVPTKIGPKIVPESLASTEDDLPANAGTEVETAALKAARLLLGHAPANGLGSEDKLEQVALPQTYAREQNQPGEKEKPCDCCLYAEVGNRVLRVWCKDLKEEDKLGCTDLTLNLDHLDGEKLKLYGTFEMQMKLNPDDSDDHRLYVFTNSTYQKSIAVIKDSAGDPRLTMMDPPDLAFPSTKDPRVFRDEPNETRTGYIHLQSNHIPDAYIWYSKDGVVSLNKNPATFRMETTSKHTDDQALPTNSTARDTISGNSSADDPESLPLEVTPVSKGKSKRRAVKKWMQNRCSVS